jgi:hypothetical protein
VQSDWTIDTLKEHYDAILVEKDKAISAALLAAEKAVTKAENAAERRFEGVNEFRQQLNDQAATFLPRAEFEAQRKADDLRLRDLAARIDRTEGQSAGSATVFGFVAAAAGVAIGVGGLIAAFAR